MDYSGVKKQMTLCLLSRGDELLLGMKKRGFGAGRWNGYGGKVEAGETVEAAARREMLEESGVSLGDMEKVGVIDFSFAGKSEILAVNIFRSNAHSGAPIETEEMKPQWFKLTEIPFTKMWPDDQYWMPLFLAGKKFIGRFHFGSGEANPIIDHELIEVDAF